MLVALGLATIALVLLPFFSDAAIAPRVMRIGVGGILIASIWRRSSA